MLQDGIVLGADTRATEGPIVCDKNCEKIHKISDNIYCCGAGTAADTENITGLIQSQLELHRLSTGKEPRVVTALTRLKQRLFRYACRKCRKLIRRNGERHVCVFFLTLVCERVSLVCAHTQM